MSDVKRYEPFGRDGLSSVMHEDSVGDYVRYDDHEAKRKGWIEQHARDSKELRELCQARDEARKERDQLRAELAAIRGQELVLPEPCLNELYSEQFRSGWNMCLGVMRHKNPQLPKQDWCSTMERPKAQCGCPDCGSSLIDVSGLPPQQPDAVSVPREVCDVPLYAAINRACEELPDEWSIEVNAERDGAWVALLNAELEVVDFPTNNERLDYTVNDAIEFALLSTRQAEEDESCAK